MPPDSSLGIRPSARSRLADVLQREDKLQEAEARGRKALVISRKLPAAGGSLMAVIESLDTLAKHHIHAVFFMVGEMAANKQAADLIDRIVREGHIIGNHTMTHQDLCRLKDEARAEREIDDAKQTIEKASGLTMYWFRTPYGVRCERVENMLDARHLGHFHWDLDPQEWKHGNAKKAIDYVEKQVGKMNGRNVLLMHDIKKATVEALPVILDWIDEENARRKTDHKRRIRIIQSYELAAQRLPPGLVDWLGDAADPHRWTSAVASVLP